jgi:hypothetical protein
LDEALRRYRDARRARQDQAELADQFASEYAEVLVGANSQERHAAAIIVAEAYDEARSLAQIELKLMAVAEMIVRIPDCEKSEGDLRGFVQAGARWRQVAEFETSRSLEQGPTKRDGWRKPRFVVA